MVAKVAAVRVVATMGGAEEEVVLVETEAEVRAVAARAAVGLVGLAASLEVERGAEVEGLMVVVMRGATAVMVVVRQELLLECMAAVLVAVVSAAVARAGAAEAAVARAGAAEAAVARAVAGLVGVELAVVALEEAAEVGRTVVVVAGWDQLAAPPAARSAAAIVGDPEAVSATVVEANQVVPTGVVDSAWVASVADTSEAAVLVETSVAVVALLGSSSVSLVEPLVVGVGVGSQGVAATAAAALGVVATAMAALAEVAMVVEAPVWADLEVAVQAAAAQGEPTVVVAVFVGICEVPWVVWREEVVTARAVMAKVGTEEVAWAVVLEEERAEQGSEEGG